MSDAPDISKPDRPGAPPLEQLAGSVRRVTFQNPENGYAVIRLAPEGDVAAWRLQPDGLLTLVGAMPGIEAGMAIQAGGQWARDPKHGLQFRVEWFKPSLPSGAKGMRAYLASGAIPGVGPVMAGKIIEAFGEDAFRVLDKEPDRLRGAVGGVGAKTLAKIKAGWRAAKGDRELITFLGDHDIAPGVATRLRKAYGERALAVVRSNPYQLIADVHGIGFLRADLIARKIGLANDAPERLDAALRHVLESQAEDGHTCLPREALLGQAGELLAGIEPAKIEERLESALASKLLVAEAIDDHAMIFIPLLHEAESRAAYRLARLAATPRRLPPVDAIAVVADFEQHARVRLAEAQRRAVLDFARQGLAILTGGPGTGKTTTVRAILSLFQDGRLRVRLAAPTGRAARRLAETSRQQADTIHRLLGFQPQLGRFARDAANPIEADLVIVDEASMMDVPLAAALLDAVAPGTCLLLIGDEDQLPSVGPGNVLGDLLASGALPVTRLTEVFRQAGRSLIVVNAHRINKGLMPWLTASQAAQGESEGTGEPEPAAEPDFFFIEREDPPAIVEAIKTLVAERIPRKFNINPLLGVQVLTPMRRGELGVDALNAALKQVLNPTAPTAPTASGAPSAPGTATANGLFQDAPDATSAIGAPGRRPALTRGDRVMQVVNNYDKNVFNGDIGHVSRVVIEDASTREIIVDFDGHPVSYLADEIDQLVLAYATTIHKSQGSEYPAVVIPVHSLHWIMLQRNLIYTALTRARRVACLVGARRALRRAVANGRIAVRHTALRHFLEQVLERKSF
jgi:exodeoxyribonuclease V alpha subunit